MSSEAISESTDTGATRDDSSRKALKNRTSSSASAALPSTARASASQISLETSSGTSTPFMLAYRNSILASSAVFSSRSPRRTSSGTTGPASPSGSKSESASSRDCSNVPTLRPPESILLELRDSTRSISELFLPSLSSFPGSSTTSIFPMPCCCPHSATLLPTLSPAHFWITSRS